MRVDHEVAFGDGARALVRSGTYVELVQKDDEHADVRVFSTRKGRRARMPLWLLRPEPKLAHRDTDDPEAPPQPVQALDYTRFTAPLWNIQPSIDDLHQGLIGDCYLIAALGAVVSTDPGVIMRMFAPAKEGASQYAITLYRRGRGQQFQAHTLLVDTFLPSAAATYDEGTNAHGHGRPHLAYEGEGERRPRVLWPALIEKAFAQLNQHGYEGIGHGDSPVTPLEAITGSEGFCDALPDTDGGVYSLLRNPRNLFARVAGSRQWDMNFGEKPLFHVTNGKLEARIPRKPFVAGTVRVHISDSVLTDDRESALVDAGGEKRAHVNYDASIITFEGSPASFALDKIVLDYGTRPENERHGLVANHAYAVEGITADGRVRLRNPWGGHDAELVLTPAEFRKSFDSISFGSMPKENAE